MAAWLKGACAIGFVALLGCQLPPDAIDPRPQDCPEAAYEQEIPVAATSATLPTGVRANVRTTDDAEGVAIDIKDNRGTVAFAGSGPVPAFIYSRIPWPEIGYTLFGGMGVSDGAWVTFWLYCTSDGALAYVYAKRTDGTPTLREYVDGTCDGVIEVWDMPVELPAHTLRNVEMTCGFTVSASPPGTPLSFESSRPGALTIDGQPTTALVFSTVDCRSGCGGDSPWFELHSLLWQPSRGRVGFAIWYLLDETTSGTGASAHGVLWLPTATWTQIERPRTTWTLSP